MPPKKLFLIPVGLPGLGKTTLARQLERHLALTQKRLFLRISYDEMLLRRQLEYQAQYKDVPFHEVIDIIRPLADKDYLLRIEGIGDSDCEGSAIIYLDRNNTPDVWADIRDALPLNSETCAIFPEQGPHEPSLYRVPNPISPALFYHSAQRIFRRAQHDCLSGADKPKAIEVLLKFARLYDNLTSLSPIS